jgi:hypothetical protein
VLEFAGILIRNQSGAQGSESGIDAIHGFLRGHNGFHISTVFSDNPGCLTGELTHDITPADIQGNTRGKFVNAIPECHHVCFSKFSIKLPEGTETHTAKYHIPAWPKSLTFRRFSCLLIIELFT